MFAVGAQDIKGETARSGEDARVGANAAGVLQHRNIADIMISVLDTPVVANGLRRFLRADGCGADVKAGLLATVPHPGFGAAEKCHSRHTDDTHDEPVPAGLFKRLSGIENLDNAPFGTHAFASIKGFMTSQRRFRLAESLDYSQQTGLIFLKLNNEMAFRRPGRPESFFDSAWRPS